MLCTAGSQETYGPLIGMTTTGKKGPHCMLTAKDVMRTDIQTIRPNAPLSEAVQMLLDHQISGLPVTDTTGFLLGVISEFALLAIIYDPLSRKQQVKDHMTKHVISVSPDTPLTELADTFILHRIRRLPVTTSGKLVGMVSRRELLRASLESGSPLCRHATAGAL
jgi:CBS domain-containing protein